MTVATILLVLISCSDRSIMTRLGREEATAGKLCQETIECGQGAYCDSNKICACLSTHVRVDEFCWPKINPGQTGCTHDRQCSATWPGAVCQNGVCKCGNGRPPMSTKDGPVCVTYGFCPINGEAAKYKDESGNPIACSNGTDSECPPAYDCICSRPGCPQNAVAFCCPSRSLACIMPIDQGTYDSGAGLTLTRWYHNTLSSECESFTYRGQGGNANNFESREHCESYCKQTCARGQPQYEETHTDEKQKQHYCSTSGNCEAGHECTPVGTVQYCCPKISSICSKTGGLGYPDQQPITGVDPGTSGGGSVTYARFYYDETEKTCMGFTYKGQGGNFNNFASLVECEQFCAKMLCQAGEPLKDPSGMASLQCDDSQCPSTHICNGGVCCPTKQTVCKLPKMVGFCNSAVRRWWFDAVTGTCEEFVYSGCHGNANSFASYRECVNFCRDVRAEPKCPHGHPLKDSYANYVTCGAGGRDSGARKPCPASHQCHYDGRTYGCCPTQMHTCTSPYEQGGQCGPAVSRWYYNQAKRACLTFDYLGCDGNSNNFATQQDCKEYCHVESCPEGGEVYREDGGIQPTCRTNSDCPDTHYCTEIKKWSDHICTQYVDSGARCSSSPIARWWFNQWTRTCEQFTYNGCAGNRNNFASRKSCMIYCVAAACPSGTVVHQDADTQRVTMCNLYGDPACPSGSTCHTAPLMQQNICCGSPPGLRDVCPTGSYAYLDPLSVQPVQCTPNVDSSCPPRYYCSYRPSDTASSTYYCCHSRGGRTVDSSPFTNDSSDSKNACPPGLVSALRNDHYQYCSPIDTIGGCALGQFCQWAESLQRYICCAADGQSVDSGLYFEEISSTTIISTVSRICPPIPPGLVPQQSGDQEGMYRTCRPQSQSDCEKGACLYSDLLAGYVCCGSDPTEEPKSAPSASSPPTSPGDQPASRDCSDSPGFAPVQPYKPCSPFVKDACGASHAFLCFYSTHRNQYVCCYRL